MARAKSNMRKFAAPVMIKAALIRSDPKVSWFKTDNVIEIHKDRITVHMFDLKDKDTSVNEAKRKKVNVSLEYKMIKEVQESNYPDGTHRVVQISIDGDLISVDGDIIAPGLLLYFRNEVKSKEGAGEEDRLKLIKAFEEHNVSMPRYDSSSSSPRSGSDASQEGENEGNQANGDVLTGGVPHEDPQSGPGSPLEDFPLDDIPIPSSQPRKIITHREGEDDEETASVANDDLKSQKEDKKLNKKFKEIARTKMTLRPCTYMVDERLARRKVDKEEFFRTFKKRVKISTWKEVRSNLHHQNSENLEVELKLKDSDIRVKQYGKHCDYLLSSQQDEYRHIKNKLQKVLQDVEVQQVKLSHLSSPTQAAMVFRKGG